MPVGFKKGTIDSYANSPPQVRDNYDGMRLREGQRVNHFRNNCPGPPRGVDAIFAFSKVNPFCIVFLYGCGGRVTPENGDFRPLVPPPVWSTMCYYKSLLAPILPY